MDRAALEARLEQLRAGYAQLCQEREQNAANLHATSGAIRECEHWLAQVPQPEAEPEAEVTNLADRRPA